MVAALARALSAVSRRGDAVPSPLASPVQQVVILDEEARLPVASPVQQAVISDDDAPAVQRDPAPAAKVKNSATPVQKKAPNTKHGAVPDASRGGESDSAVAFRHVDAPVLGDLHQESPALEPPIATTAKLHTAVRGEESDDDEGGLQHLPEDAFQVGDSCEIIAPRFGQTPVSGKVTGRVISRVSQNIIKYVVAAQGEIVVVPCRNVMESAGGFIFGLESEGTRKGDEEEQNSIAEWEDDMRAAGHDIEVAGALTNESGVLAAELAADSSIETFDVAKMSAHDIWHSILLKRNLNGGMLTRTILIDATKDSNCLPLWTGVTYQEKTVALKKNQGSDFIQHFASMHKIAWLRMKVFSAVATSRNTYSKIRVTFNGHTSLSLATAGAPELTDELRCRISHLALDPNCSRLLGLIFGSRDNLEKTDNKTLTNPALWNDLATLFVNNPVWQPYSAAIEGVTACQQIDCTVAPAKPGLEGATVQDVFLDCRTDWTRLTARVFSATGSNSTGAKLLTDVWDNYICGGRLKFPRNVVTMYVFTTWHAAGKNLPELCNRQLQIHQQLILGVGPAAADACKTPAFKTPEKIATPRGIRNHFLLQQPLTQIATAMSQFQDLLSSSKSVSTPTHDTVSSPESAITTPQGMKRPACIPEPDPDLGNFLEEHNIRKWWPQIYDKLGITNISDLRFIGKTACETYLKGLPALPVMRLAILADSKAALADSTASLAGSQSS